MVFLLASGLLLWASYLQDEKAAKGHHGTEEGYPLKGDSLLACRFHFMNQNRKGEKGAAAEPAEPVPRLYKSEPLKNHKSPRPKDIGCDLCSCPGHRLGLPFVSQARDIRGGIEVAPAAQGPRLGAEGPELGAHRSNTENHQGLNKQNGVVRHERYET